MSLKQDWTKDVHSLFYGKMRAERPVVTIEEIEAHLKNMYPDADLCPTYNELRSRVIPGFFYTIKHPHQRQASSTMVSTGSGGVLEYISRIEAMEMIHPSEVARTIIMHTKDVSRSILYLKLKVKDNE